MKKVDDSLVKAVIHAESSGKADAEGPKTKYGTAKGLMQLIDSTGKELHKKLGLEGEYDPYDAEQNVILGTAYLNDMMRLFGEERLALAAYNWGPGNLQKLIKRIGTNDFQRLFPHLPRETQNYVYKVQKKRNQLLA